MWSVYILKCDDGTYYTGCTSDVNDRFTRHNNGQVKYTSSRLPVELILTSNFNDKYKAYDFESYLKSGSGKIIASKSLL